MCLGIQIRIKQFDSATFTMVDWDSKGCVVTQTRSRVFKIFANPLLLPYDKKIQPRFLK